MTKVIFDMSTSLDPDSGQDTALELVESRATASGVIFQIYRTVGRLQYGEEPRPT